MDERTTRQHKIMGKQAKALPEPDGLPEKPLRPSQCRAHMRKVLAKEFREIMNGFVKSAKRGSCQHVKLTTELLEMSAPKTPKKRASRSLVRWVEEVEALQKEL